MQNAKTLTTEKGHKTSIQLAKQLHNPNLLLLTKLEHNNPKTHFQLTKYQ